MLTKGKYQAEVCVIANYPNHTTCTLESRFLWGNNKRTLRSKVYRMGKDMLKAAGDVKGAMKVYALYIVKVDGAWLASDFEFMGKIYQRRSTK